MELKNKKKLKRWIIENIEGDLRSFTYPIIKKATEKNIIKAIKNSEDAEKGTGEYYQLQDLKEDLEIFKIIEKWN